MPSNSELVYRYLAANKQKLNELGITVESEQVSTEHVKAVNFDFESVAAIGRITVWEAGFLDAEVLGFESGAQIYFEHVDVADEATVASILEKFIASFR